MGVETVALTTLALTAAGTAAKVGYDFANDPGEKAQKAQKALEDQRARDLADLNTQRANSAAAAAVSGKNFGTRASYLDAYGFGSGNTKTGLGTGNLFG